MTTRLEINRHRRGHDFFPHPDALAAIPRIYGTEVIDAPDRIVHLHYFTATSDWWITELDHDTGIAYGYACLNRDGWSAEWGYTDLHELEALYLPIDAQHPLPTLVHRDLGWTPTALRDLHLPGRT